MNGPEDKESRKEEYEGKLEENRKCRDDACDSPPDKALVTILPQSGDFTGDS